MIADRWPVRLLRVSDGSACAIVTPDIARGWQETCRVKALQLAVQREELQLVHWTARTSDTRVAARRLPGPITSRATVSW